MRIVVDLDGTICTLKEKNETYNDVVPLKESIESLQKLKQDGHEIIIHTARNMKTWDGNIGKVVANIGKDTLEWLDKYNIPYDEVVFGKPYGDIYIDDKALSFTSWDDVIKTIDPSDNKS